MVSRRATITTTVSLLVPWHPKRKTLIISNASATTFSISENAGSPTTDGIDIVQNGNMTEIKEQGGNPEGPYFAATAAGSATAAIKEVYETTQESEENALARLAGKSP